MFKILFVILKHELKNTRMEHSVLIIVKNFLTQKSAANSFSEFHPIAEYMIAEWISISEI